ncbi:MAG: aminopeptidase P family protein [Pyrinomonadaceae bacterium]
MKRVITWILLSAFVLSGLAAVIMADVNKTFGPGGIKTAPAAPKFAHTERQSELARRRAEAAKRMAPNSIMILWSAQPRNYAGDVDFYYRQENNLYYLTNLKQGDATLVIAKNGDNVSEYLFVPKRNPQFETWNGKMYSNEDAIRISGIRTVIDSAEQTAYFTSLGKKETFASKGGVNVPSSAETLYLLLPNSERDENGTAEFSRESDFSKMVSSYKVLNARPIFTELRSIKSPLELKLLQHAIDITTEAQMRSMAMVGRAKMEYEVHAEVEYTFRRRNADYWGYPSIVGCGANATTLHYVESQGDITQGTLLLMDVGAEYDHYTADVTRTYPVSGKFSKEQAEIYQIVYDAQEAVAAVTKPEAKMSAIEKASVDSVKAGLLKLGLITSLDGTYDATLNGQSVKISQHRLWFMHGNSHWLGMNVHDVGDYAAPLKPGMVFTNEPGVYLREDALDYLADTPDNRAFLAKVRPVYEKYRGIGVRIEDDMLVTATGVEWMTKELPRKMNEIEAFMAKASKEFAYTAMNKTIPSNIFIDHARGEVFRATISH